MYTLYTCIYNTHTLHIVRDTGVSLDQGQFIVFSLVCSNATISKNQNSSLSIKDKYIFTDHSRPTFKFYILRLLMVELFAIQLDMCFVLECV